MLLVECLDFYFVFCDFFLEMLVILSLINLDSKLLDFSLKLCDLLAVICIFKPLLMQLTLQFFNFVRIHKDFS